MSIAKKLSAVDRLTLATGVAERLNDQIKSGKEKFLKDLQESHGYKKTFEEKSKTTEGFLREINEIDKEIKKLENKKDSLSKDIYRTSGTEPSYSILRSNTLEERIKLFNRYIKENLESDAIKKANLKIPLDEYKMKSLINKGQSLALLAEDQDPQAVDTLLMTELSKQI